MKSRVPNLRRAAASLRRMTMGGDFIPRTPERPAGPVELPGPLFRRGLTPALRATVRRRTQVVATGGAQPDPVPAGTRGCKTSDHSHSLSYPTTSPPPFTRRSFRCEPPRIPDIVQVSPGGRTRTPRTDCHPHGGQCGADDGFHTRRRQTAAGRAPRRQHASAPVPHEHFPRARRKSPAVAGERSGSTSSRQSRGLRQAPPFGRSAMPTARLNGARTRPRRIGCQETGPVLRGTPRSRKPSALASARPNRRLIPPVPKARSRQCNAAPTTLPPQ
jgi:hypothetical protein